MLANVYTMVTKRCGHTTERETVTYTEDPWVLKALRPLIHSKAEDGSVSWSISPLSLSPPGGSRASFEQPVPRGHRSLSR